MSMLWTSTSTTMLNVCINSQLPILLQGRSDFSLGRCRELLSSRSLLTGKLHSVSVTFKSSASKRRKKLREEGEMSTSTFMTEDIPLKDQNIPDKFVMINEAKTKDKPGNGLERKISLPVSTRNTVLQACIITSGLIFALGATLRLVSHVAFSAGWTKLDSSSQLSFNIESWHLEMIVGLVAWISTCRYALLKKWPDFAESSEAANQQVLGPLYPLDYVLVAFLPGISEELLFRGALLPLVGLNWGSALAIGALFGGLHLGGGRKYSFAIWATMVGFTYGMATIASSSIVVPMAAHSLNNLVGGIIWFYAHKPKDEPPVS